MKAIYPALLLLLLALACEKKDPTPVTPVFSDPDWMRLEIPNGREAFAVTGDINKTLLATTLSKAHRSVDGGKTWQLSKDFQGTVPGLLVRNDTIISLNGFSYSPNDTIPYAAAADPFFTADQGVTWLRYNQYLSFSPKLRKPIGLVQASDGTTYAIKENKTPIDAMSAYINPSDIWKVTNSRKGLLDFPFRHRITNLYLDAQNRLYVTVSGTHVPETNQIFCCPEETPAYIYVSKRPLP